MFWTDVSFELMRMRWIPFLDRHVTVHVFDVGVLRLVAMTTIAGVVLVFSEFEWASEKEIMMILQEKMGVVNAWIRRKGQMRPEDLILELEVAIFPRFGLPPIVPRQCKGVSMIFVRTFHRCRCVVSKIWNVVQNPRTYLESLHLTLSSESLAFLFLK